MQGNKQCFGCRYLDRYYIRGVKKFTKTKFGWCCATAEVVDIHNGCDRFAQSRPLKRSKYGVQYCLNDLLTQITELRKLLEDDIDEEL